MPSYTPYLNLSLPAFSEFLDSWNEPMNQNFEDLDDWTNDLYKSLVSTGGSSTWAALRGSLTSLAARLDVSINADGTIDVSASQDILDMSTSAYHGQYSNPRDRLNAGDGEVYDARQPFVNGRFDVMPAAGPAAGFPGEQLDAGIAFRTADFGGDTPDPTSSPHKPWSPGLVMGGANPLIAGGGVGQVILNAATKPAIFNIDGYIFRLRETILFDYSAIPGLLANDFVWIYVERGDASYTGNTIFKYSQVGGIPVAKDLRKLKTGADGITANSPLPLTPSTFTSATGTFDSDPFKVKEGDILRITSGAAAGDYVINALDGTTPNTKLTIRGKFKADLSGAPYQIIDNAMPHIGAAIAASTPSDQTSRPPAVDGRVYIGRVKHLGGLPPSPLVTFTRGGVFDSGWLAADSEGAGLNFPMTLTHELGVVPSSVEIWVRADSTSRAYRPLVQRQVLAEFDEGNFPNPVAGDPKRTTFLVPSLFSHMDELNITMEVLNASPNVTGENLPAIFTNSGGTDEVVGEIRVVARR